MNRHAQDEQALVRSFARLREASNWQSFPPMEEPAASVRWSASSGPLRSRTRVGLITAAVATVVIAGTVAVLTSTFGASRAVQPGWGAVPSKSVSTSAGDVQALPRVSGRLLGTWSSDAPPPAGPFDARGEAIVTTSTCAGGGSLRVAIAGHGDSSTDCSSDQVSGPAGYTENGVGIRETEPVSMTVTASGPTRYAVQLWAVPIADVPAPVERWSITSTAPGVPSSLRTCRAADFAATGSFTPSPQSQGGLVTVTSASASDCAVRRWPVLRYLDAGGRSVGPQADQSIGSGTGSIRAQGQFPAARLRAGGRLFLEVTVFKAATIERLSAAGAGTCDSRPVVALRIALAATGRPVLVPIDSGPARATCSDPSQHLSGVGPAVDRRPTEY